jgi:hypothetical protein
LRLKKQYRAVLAKLRVAGDREAQNIFKLEIDEMLSETFAKPAKILNPFSPRFFFYLDFALLDFPDRISAEPFDN